MWSRGDCQELGDIFGQKSDKTIRQDWAMTPTIPEDIPVSSRPPSHSVAMALAAAAGLVAAGTAALWIQYGTAVFYETIIAGINACF
jgi:hypothetical protein